MAQKCSTRSLTYTSSVEVAHTCTCKCRQHSCNENHTTSNSLASSFHIVGHHYCITSACYAMIQSHAVGRVINREGWGISNSLASSFHIVEYHYCITSACYAIIRSHAVGRVDQQGGRGKITQRCKGGTHLRARVRSSPECDNVREGANTRLWGDCFGEIARVTPRSIGYKFFQPNHWCGVTPTRCAWCAHLTRV